MACKNVNLALASLKKVWNHDDFKSLSSSGEAKLAFRALSLHYTMPWWFDEYDQQRQSILERLILEVSSGKRESSTTTASSSGQGSSKSKASKGRKKQNKQKKNKGRS